jgi:hypothetical protein
MLAADPVGRVAVEGRNAPPHFADQLERYDALNTVDPVSLSEADLDTYFKRADLDVAVDHHHRTRRGPELPRRLPGMGDHPRGV